jgi:hypothetical protein
MKTPRVTDFDPEAKVPELKSSMDNMPVIGKPKTTPLLNTTDNIQLYQSNRHTTERSNAPTSVRPNSKRIITRNSFEIYEDQMDSLRRLSYQEKMDGKLGSMSNMVREAIDDYLQRTSSDK